jgi:hypothetical protein
MAVVARHTGETRLVHHDLGAGHNHPTNVDRHARKHAQWLEQERKGRRRDQDDGGRERKGEPQDAYVPAMAHGGAESTIAIATTEPGKHPRRSLLDLGYGR